MKGIRVVMTSNSALPLKTVSANPKTNYPQRSNEPHSIDVGHPPIGTPEHRVYCDNQNERTHLNSKCHNNRKYQNCQDQSNKNAARRFPGGGVAHRNAMQGYTQTRHLRDDNSIVPVARVKMHKR